MTVGTDTSVARALEGLGDGVLLLDRELRVEHANPAVERLFGVPRHALLGRVLWEVLPTPLDPEAERRLSEAAAGAGAWELELLAPGTARPVACRAVPSSGGLALFLHDAAEPGRRSDEDERAKKARDQVVSIVSHDLRGPLNAIALNAAVLTRRPGDPRALGAIKTSLAQAHRLIEDLVVAARVEAGTLVVKRQPEPLGAIVDEVVAQHAGEARAKDVRLEVSVDGADATVLVDRLRVVQALGTLVARATAASPRGERVTLSASARAGRLEVEIHDAGPGLSTEETECLFERCWERARVAKSGKGLGLCIAKGLAEAHGGDVTLESAPDRGTRLTLVIPPPAVQAHESDQAYAP